MAFNLCPTPNKAVVSGTQSSLSAQAMPAKVKSKARDKADFWDRAYNPTVEIEYSDEEVARPRPTLLISGHLRTLRSRTSAATAEPTPQTTAQLLKEADKTAAKKNAKAKVAAAAKKPDQIVLCKKFGPCVKARVELETQGEPHICRCYDSKLDLTTLA